LATGIGLAALLALTSACGSDDGDSSASSATGPTATSSSTAGTGTAADPSKSKVLIGWHNLEGGSISLPDYRIGFEQGIKYVNEKKGGINGHPLESFNCKTDGTPDSSVNCANQFVEKKVVLAVQGADFGADGMLPVLRSAKITDIVGFPLTPGINTAVGDVVTMQSSSQEGYAATSVQLQNLGAKKIAFMMVEAPASHAAYDGIIKPASDKLGVETKIFYVTAGSDISVAAQSALAYKPDAVASFLAADSVQLVPALRSAGFTGYITSGANVEIVPQLDAKTLEKVLFNAPFFLPDFANIPAASQPDLDAFAKYMEGTPSTKNTTQRQNGFYIAVMAARLLQDTKVDPLTADAVHSFAPTWKGDREFFRTNGWDCSKPTWPGTTACASGSYYATTGPDKKLAPLPDQPVDVSKAAF
jgi:branched-chain amino acid transport system substrate-binding protein